MEILPFDTELTLLYKKAKETGIPVEFYLVYPRDQNVNIFGTSNFAIASTEDIISSYEGFSLKELGTITDPIETKVDMFPKYLAWNYMFAYVENINSYVKNVPSLDKLKEENPEFVEVMREVADFYISHNYEIPGVSDKDLEDPKQFGLVIERLMNEYKEFYRIRNPANTEMKQTIEIADEIEKIQKRILKYYKRSDDIEQSPFNKKAETIIYSLFNADKQRIKKEDGFDLFDIATTYQNVPYMEYVSEETKTAYYKMYSEGDPQSYQRRIKTIEKSSSENRIYLQVLFQHPYDFRKKNIEQISESDYVPVKINLKEGIIKFKITYNKSFPEKLEMFLDDENTENIYGARTISEWVILNEVFSVFSEAYLSVSDRREDDVKLDVSLYDVSIDGVTLSYYLSQKDSIAGKYLHMEEFTHPEALNNQIKVWYRPFPMDDPNVPRVFVESKALTSKTLNANIFQDYTSLGIAYLLKNSDEENEEENTIRKYFPAFTPYVDIHIIRNTNIENGKEFIDMLTALIPLYEKSKEETLSFLNPYFTKKEMKTLFPPPPVFKEKKGIQLINLIDAIPIFKEGLSRESQQKYQTKIIQYKDLEEWVQQVFRFNNETYHRDALAFPKPPPSLDGIVLLARYRDGMLKFYVERSKKLEQRFKSPMKNKSIQMEYLWITKDEYESGNYSTPETWTVCPPKAGLFIDVKASVSPAIIPVYPYIPHCFRRIHIEEDPLKSEGSGFSKFYLNQEESEKYKIKSDYIHKTNKILSVESKGKLDSDVLEILDTYSKKKDQSTFYRFGVPKSPNSLLHSILIALFDPEYEKTKNREKYIQDVRRTIANEIRPELLKQELYDKSLEEIQDMLGNVELYLDPQIYYRALEEFFHINLYTYGHIQGKYAPKDADIELLVPRHLLFHVQAYRERKTLLVLKNWGGSTDLLEHPQCELIMEDRKGTSPVALFDPEMGEIHYNIMKDTHNVYAWKIYASSMLQRLSVPSIQLDYSLIFKDTIQSQVIDEYGKLRAIFFKIDQTEMVMFVHPSQPVSAPNKTLCVDTENIRIPKAPLKLVLDNFGEPQQITKNHEGKITGFWFGDPSVFYIPIQDLSSELQTHLDFNSLPLGTETPLDVQRNQDVERLKTLKGNLSRIQQLLWWCWKIAQRKMGMSLTSFLKDYLTYDNEEVPDSAYYYYLGGIPRILPSASNVMEAIEWIQINEEEGIQNQLADPSLIQGRLIDDDMMFHCYDETFYKKIQVWIEKKDKLTQSTSLNSKNKDDIPTTIQYYYTIPQDFYSTPEEVVFIGKDVFKKWLKSASQYKSQYTIHSSISTSQSLSSEPFLFREQSTNKIYLIQNVKNGDISRALHASELWKTQKYNPGINVEPISTENLDYVIYGNTFLTSKQELTLLEKHQNKDNLSFQPLRILQYNSKDPKRYAAMLELL